MSQYVERAVGALLSHVSSGYAAALRATETELGLASGALTDPVAYVGANVEPDNRAPLVSVYEEGYSWVTQRQRLLSVDCTIVIGLLGGPDIASLWVSGRRYATAMFRCILADATLGGQAVAAVLQSGGTVAPLGDRSRTRLVYLIPVEVRVMTPE